MRKTLIENYQDTVWNKKNTAIISQVFDEDAIIHSPLGVYHGPAAMEEIVSHWLTSFPDLNVQLLNTITENDTVVSHWRASGTHKGEFRGVAATNRPIEYEGVTIFRIDGDKIKEYWAYLQMDHLLSQLRPNVT